MNEPLLQSFKFLLFITDRCNLVCKMCPIIINDPKAKTRRTLPRELAFHAADFAKRRGFKEVEVAGGEATVVDYFWELLAKLCECDAEVRLVTNGLMTTDEHIAEYRKYPNLQVQVSIDGTGGIHDKIRGAKGSYDRAVNTLERLASAGCRRISINTVVQRTNWFDLVNTYESLKHLPYLYHAFSMVEEKEAPKEMIAREDIAGTFNLLREVSRRAEVDGKDVILSEDLLRAYYLRMRLPGFLMHPGEGCSVVRDQVVVQIDGSVLPCFHTAWPGGEDWNLHNHTLDEIIDSPAYKAAIQKAISPGGCYGCSTMCYNWNEDFRRKVMNPNLQTKAYQQILLSKEYLRDHHPAIFGAAKRVRATMRSSTSQPQ
jgi:MoaA/NifB/PqqE/SkfB family radical SAM enzyme